MIAAFYPTLPCQLKKPDLLCSRRKLGTETVTFALKPSFRIVPLAVQRRFRYSASAQTGVAVQKTVSVSTANSPYPCSEYGSSQNAFSGLCMFFKSLLLFE